MALHFQQPFLKLSTVLGTLQTATKCCPTDFTSSLSLTPYDRYYFCKGRKYSKVLTMQSVLAFKNTISIIFKSNARSGYYNIWATFC